MVKVFKHTHRYDDPPSTVLLAFYLRYPNPFASHVLSCDVISRTFDPSTGAMRTTRLLLKRGIIPKWARSWLGGLGGMEAWVMEESEVLWEGEQPRLVSSTRNISHKKIMTVIEGTDLVYAGMNRGTLHKTTAHIVSDFGGSLGSLVRGQIETWGAGRFEGNAETARQGMSLILSLLRSSQPLPQTSESRDQIARREWEDKYSYKSRGPGAAGPSGSGSGGARADSPASEQGADLLNDARRRAKGKQKASASEDDLEDTGVDGRAGASDVAAPHSFFLSRSRRSTSSHGGDWTEDDGGHTAQSTNRKEEAAQRSTPRDGPRKTLPSEAATATGWTGWWRGKG